MIDKDENHKHVDPPVEEGEVEVNIQDIVRERKSERRILAEQKRHTDLERIRDMRSTTGIDPLLRFPKEIWSMIFSELNPRDRENSRQVHPLFRDLMESTRVRDTLFPLVLEIDKLEEYMSSYNIFSNNYHRLRAVSKNMRKSYDRWIEERVKRRIQEEEADPYPDLSITGPVTLHLYSRSERKKLKTLLSSFEHDQESPSPAKRYFPRALCVSFDDDDIEKDDHEDIADLINDYKKDLLSLLNLIGDQIWNFRVYFPRMEEIVEFSTSQQIYIGLQQIVTLMPNLKWLEINVEVWRQVIREREEEEEILGKYPFPTLSSLERLTFHWPFQVGGGFNIFENVLRANKHVKILDLREIRGKDFSLDDDEDDTAIGLIKSLNLTGFRPCSDELFGATTVENIKSIVNFNWPLQTIHLNLDYTGKDNSKAMSSILQFLEGFPTLETVKLKELKNIRFGSEHETFGYLKLPNLKHLEILLMSPEIQCGGKIEFFFSLQFLLHCKKLKTLHWDMRPVEDAELRTYLKRHEKNGNTIGFRAGLRCLYESNIWEVFPSLDIIEVEIAKLARCCDNYAGNCVHTYRRRAFVDGSVSIGRFLNGHKCSRENSLQNCAVLQE